MRRAARSLAILIALAAAAGCLVGCGSSSSSDPDGPRAAAQAWADTLLSEDSDGREELTCAAGTQSEALIGMLGAAVTGYRAGRVTKDGPESWRVTLVAEEIGGDGLSLEVPVVEEGGRYLVCWGHRAGPVTSIVASGRTRWPKETN